MRCHTNSLTDPDTHHTIQMRVEAVLGPYSDRIESFGLSKPKDGWMVVEVVYKNKRGPDDLITIPDETTPHMEERILSSMRHP